MSTVLALPLLYEAVVADFAAAAAAEDPPVDPVPQPFGWRAPDHRTGTKRIVWVPGDQGDVGEVGSARNPGRNPRPLLTINELFTVFVEAFDASAPENELVQYTAARLLLDDVLGAVHRAAHGTVTVQGVRWVDEKKVRRHGATLRVVLSIEAMVPDRVRGTAPTDTAANVTTYPSATGVTEGETDTVSAA